MSDASVLNENCPRCDRARAPGEDACARCGLMVVRWSGFREDADDPPEFAPLWQECLAAWSDEATHDRLLLSMTNLAALPSLARRYRARLDGDPEDAVARSRLQQVAILVETGARAQAKERLDATSAFRLVWVLGHVVGLLGVGAAAYFLARTFTQH